MISGNLRSVELILLDLHKFLKLNLLNEESEKNILSFVLYASKNEKNKMEDSVIENLIRLYKEYISAWNNYNKLLDLFKSSDNLFSN